MRPPLCCGRREEVHSSGRLPCTLPAKTGCRRANRDPLRQVLRFCACEYWKVLIAGLYGDTPMGVKGCWEVFQFLQVLDNRGRREDQVPSGYTRLFGIEALGNLMSRIQGAVTASGNELEKLIMERVKKIDDLDRFLTKRLHSQEPGVWVARKIQIKRSRVLHPQYEPDLLSISLRSAAALLLYHRGRRRRSIRHEEGCLGVCQPAPLQQRHFP